MKSATMITFAATSLFSALALTSPASAAAGDTAAAKANPQDFEGMWIGSEMQLFMGVDLPYTEAGQNLMADRIQLVKAGHSEASAHMTCRPTGVQNVVAPKSVILILQTPEKLVVLTQEDREVRFVHLSRAHPKPLTPTYSGDSVGKWEGDTLVIDTAGYNGRGQLDEVGNPQSSQSHVVERWTKSPDDKYLTAEFTFTDPVYLAEPYKIIRRFQRMPGARLADYDCAENPRSDDFDNLTFVDDWYKPACVRPIVNGISGARVVCKVPGKSPEQH